MFAMHGAQKLFGWFTDRAAVEVTGGMGIFGIDVGINMLFVAGIIEFFGGLLIVIGLATRWAAALAAILMIMAVTHAHWGLNPLATGGENALLYLFVWIAVFAYGPGPYSIDAKVCPDTQKELAAYKKRK